MRIYNLERFASQTEINLNFKNYTNTQMFTEIGNFLYNSCKKIPEGIIVFIKSYYLLNILIQTLSIKGFINRIQIYKKVAIEKQNNNENQEQKKLFLNNAKEGAILFAVMGGKFSEGFDFMDYMARGIFILGIPYANFKDKKLKAKKDYLKYNHGNNK